MIADVVALCTAAYVVIDDLYQAYLAPLDRRPGPRGQCSDSEIVALTLVAELVGLDEAVAFLAYLRRNHPTLFPRLPERSRYNRRRRALQEATGTLRRLIQRRVWAALPADRRDLCVIDSLPVPVVGFAHACGRHRWRGHAAYGYNATKKQALYGFTRHLLATHSGLILDVALVPANIVDGDLSAQLLQDQTGLTVLGDEAYLSAALRERLRHPCAGTRNGVDLLAPTKANARAPMATPLVRRIAHFRQAIETLNSQLAGQCNVERYRAKCLSGLCARVQATLAAHTLGISLNQQADQPLLALKPLALI